MKRLWRTGALLMCLAFLLLFSSCTSDEPVPASALEARSLCVALGGERPSAADFLTDRARRVCEERGVEVAFSAEPDFSSLGDKQAVLSLTGKGVQAAELTVEYTVLTDVTPPVLSGVRALSFVVGDGAVLRQGVSAVDDCFGSVTLHVDATGLDMNHAGLYSVTYRAVDAVGNEARQTANVTVYDEPFNAAAFESACDAILADILPRDADRVQICRAVYAYVRDALVYFPVSDHSDADRAAQTALELRRGDCFSYFSLAKALLERAGVPCLGIERIHEAGSETHFWLMVDIAEPGQAPRWYHFDPTELNAAYGDHNGCLFTDAQLDAYNAVRPGFYDYDRAAYPESESKILSASGKEGER